MLSPMSVKTRSVFLSPMAPVLAWYLDHSQHSLRTDQINSLIQEMFWKHQNMSDTVLGQRTLGEQSRARPYSHGASQVALVVKNLPASAGEVRGVGSIPGSGRSPGGGHGYPLQYSCLENPLDRGAGGPQSIASQSRTRLR